VYRTVCTPPFKKKKEKKKNECHASWSSKVKVAQGYQTMEFRHRSELLEWLTCTSRGDLSTTSFQKWSRSIFG
jgi:hypothetical protein